MKKWTYEKLVNLTLNIRPNENFDIFRRKAKLYPTDFSGRI